MSIPDPPPQPDGIQTGSQQVRQEEQTDEQLKSLSARSMEGLTLASTIEGLAATRSRQLGGDVAASLIAGYSTHMAGELLEAKQEIVRLRSENSGLNDRASSTEKKCAVLTERLYGESRSRHLRNISISVGTGLLALSVELLRNEQSTYSTIVCGVGLLMIGLGWFAAPRENDRS